MTKPFVPILTVMADYGKTPFLWRVTTPDQRGIGSNTCCGVSWHESDPMSEGLWQKFAAWAIAFDRTCFNFGTLATEPEDWDWFVFHAHGMQLARWLKEEVGDAYRVRYIKPIEDPNHRIDEVTEILASGELLPLLQDFFNPRRFCQHIISGGQTGADRAALDFAIQHGYTHGGWAPHGRQAEDGAILPRYQLTELAAGGYRQRTRRNVEDSDGTLILNLGELDGGSLMTHRYAESISKPCLLLQLDAPPDDDALNTITDWLQRAQIRRLNIAGPRESKRPGIYRAAYACLIALDAHVRPLHERQAP